jgi:hypothetical protein
MTKLKGLFRFLWEFVVGDDWRIAVAVVIAIVVTAILGHNGVRAWWLLPIVVAALLSLSVWDAARAKR